MKILVLVSLLVAIQEAAELDDLEELVSQLVIQQDNMQNELTKLTERATDSMVTCGDDWISYLDTKCFKVLDRNGTVEEGKDYCRQLDGKSTLITIGSQEEQNFVNGLIGKYNGLYERVWIGLERVNNGWKWMDGHDFNYTNWDANAVNDGNTDCVEISVCESNRGKWSYDMCQKKYLVACQKKRYPKYMDIVFPIGFLYSQLPNQSSPQQLWPSLQWLDVTQQYSGLFFRAEGSGSEPFGQIQHGNQSWISDIWTSSHEKYYYGITNVHDGTKADNNMNIGNWTVFNPGQTINFAKSPMFDRLEFFTTEGEVRPRNTAIRIWMRIN